MRQLNFTFSLIWTDFEFALLALFTCIRAISRRNRRVILLAFGWKQGGRIIDIFVKKFMIEA